MPVTIDITKDLRYRQGVTEGIELHTIETAENLLKNGFDFNVVQKITNLPISRIDEIARTISMK